MRVKKDLGKIIFFLLLTVQVHPLAAQEEKGKSLAAPAAAAEVDKKEPTFIRSKTFDLDSEKRVFNYNDEVEVTQGDMKMFSSKLTGNYDGNNKIQKMIATGNVFVEKGPAIKASGGKATYYASNETVVLEENPELQQDGSVLVADRVTIFLQENRSTAEGRVRVKVLQKEQDPFNPNSLVSSKPSDTKNNKEKKRK